MFYKEKNASFLSGVYGILREHRVPLCTGYQSNYSNLQQHLLTHHRLQHRFATRLTQAVMEDVDPTVRIFQTNEIIVENE